MDITSEIRSAVSSVARAHGIALIGLFGSLATAQARVGSDVDIAVRFRDRKPTLRRLLDVQRDLSPIFPGREIDIASVERADPLFMKKIAERLVVLFEEAGESAAFLCLAFKRYQDHRRYLAMESDFASRYVEKIAR
jgi:predicted nucleotidyltransferase